MSCFIIIIIVHSCQSEQHLFLNYLHSVGFITSDVYQSAMGKRGRRGRFSRERGGGAVYAWGSGQCFGAHGRQEKGGNTYEVMG